MVKIQCRQICRQPVIWIPNDSTAMTDKTPFGLAPGISKQTNFVTAAAVSNEQLLPPHPSSKV
jgi:hypothetical protein